MGNDWKGMKTVLLCKGYGKERVGLPEFHPLLWGDQSMSECEGNKKERWRGFVLLGRIMDRCAVRQNCYRRNRFIFFSLFSGAQRSVCLMDWCVVRQNWYRRNRFILFSLFRGAQRSVCLMGWCTMRQNRYKWNCLNTLFDYRLSDEWMSYGSMRYETKSLKKKESLYLDWFKEACDRTGKEMNSWKATTGAVLGRLAKDTQSLPEWRRKSSGYCARAKQAGENKRATIGKERSSSLITIIPLTPFSPTSPQSASRRVDFAKSFLGKTYYTTFGHESEFRPMDRHNLIFFCRYLTKKDEFLPRSYDETW